MDGDMSQPTQPATQNVIDPRRIGKQNSGFTDEDIADIICLLFPYSINARNEAARLAREGSPYVIGRDEARTVDIDYTYEDYAGNFGLSTADPGSGPAFVLRLSASVKDPLQGFTFGRNANRCDICFNNDSLRRLSNIHFSIFINEHGVLMLQDQSTNGTIVDEVLLKAHRPGMSNKRTLNSGTKISVLLQNDAHDLEFLVRVPRREGQYESAYQRNLHAYLERLAMLADPDESTEPQTIGAGPAGIVDLFPAPPQHAGRTAATGHGHGAGAGTGTTTRRPPPRFEANTAEVLPRDWNGSTNYNRVGQIGKGAFAIVYKVTSKYNGRPYAAKELDKRRFVKNGVLDQKVENEMKIMQKIQHPNIVRYIEHFDFDDRLFIIIMEYVPMGDLGSYITNRGCLPEATARDMAIQLIDALAYLHQKNITHRDVKPDNILIDSLSPFSVKLTDFGLSKMVDNEQTFLQTFCGTLLYCAPEVYGEYADYDESGMRSNRHRRKPQMPGQRYGHAVDIWSLGGVLFYSLTGRPPYPVKQGTTYVELLNLIMTRPLNVAPLYAANVSPNCIHFLMLMLQNRAERRATVQALQSHPWIAGPAASSTDSLEQSASQLSIADVDQRPDTRLDGYQSDDEILDDEDFFGTESQVNALIPRSGPSLKKNENREFNDYDDADRPLHQPPITVAEGTPQQFQQQPRLFGEVNVSAIGSSGVIPEDRLNLPLSDLGSSMNNEQSVVNYESESGESGNGETFLTPRGQQLRQQQQQQQGQQLGQQLGQQWSQPRSQRNVESNGGGGAGTNGGVTHVPAPLSQSLNFQDSHSVDELNNLTFDVASQSLGGAESILENLNMKSVAALNFKHSVTDFSSSKRKPAPDTSDEFENTRISDKPTIKRLKSEVRMDSVFDGAGSRSETAISHPTGDTGHAVEDSSRIYAAVKPVNYSKTGRQMDLPVPKSVYWTPGDPSSWHLQYPEMTQLQYDAFEDAASARGEEFGPGPSQLWKLAMQHFPPSTTAAMRAESEPRSRSRSTSNVPESVVLGGGGASSGNSEDDQKENVMPRTATAAQQATPPHPHVSPQPPQSQQRDRAKIIVPVVSKPMPVARLDSVPGSVVRNIYVPIAESITTWGRHPDNTLVFVPKTELKVPKYGFNILLWRSDGDGGIGSEPWKDLRPWGRFDALGEVASRYHFYISTKARAGILVNGTVIGSSEPSSPQTAPRYWTRLYDGDSIVVWHNTAGDPSAMANIKPLRTELVFHCTWGGSAWPRPTTASSPAVTLADEATSQRLDEVYVRAQRYVVQRTLQQRCLAAADDDIAERMERIDQERLRSVAFEHKRADILGGTSTGGQHMQQQRAGRPHLEPSPVSAPPILVSASNDAYGSSSLTPTPSAAASQALKDNVAQR